MNLLNIKSRQLKQAQHNIVMACNMLCTLSASQNIKRTALKYVSNDAYGNVMMCSILNLILFRDLSMKENLLLLFAVLFS